jgi:hypothetical protein
LYTYGRYLDLKESMGINAPWLVTNTKFSSDVVRYAKCVGINLIGWNYPEGAGLEELVRKADIYPLTVLDIRRGEQRTLLSHDFVICRDILERKSEVMRLFPKEIADRVIQKAEEFRECVGK